MDLEIDCTWEVKKLDELRTLLSFWIGSQDERWCY